MTKPRPRLDELFPESSPQTDLARGFAEALAAGEFARARALLSTPLRNKTSAASLKKAFKDMVAYGEGRAGSVQVVMAMAEWPDRKRNDLEWVHVAIANDSYSEGVTVVVSSERGRLVIRSVEWGRP